MLVSLPNSLDIYGISYIPDNLGVDHRARLGAVVLVSAIASGLGALALLVGEVAALDEEASVDALLNDDHAEQDVAT